MAALGRFQPVATWLFLNFERPLLVKADVQNCDFYKIYSERPVIARSHALSC